MEAFLVYMDSVSLVDCLLVETSRLVAWSDGRGEPRDGMRALINSPYLSLRNGRSRLYSPETERTCSTIISDTGEEVSAFWTQASEHHRRTSTGRASRAESCFKMSNKLDHNCLESFSSSWHHA